MRPFLFFAAVLLGCNAALAGYDECFEATCRIRMDGHSGTGCVYADDKENIYVLTNAHVAGTRPGGRPTCEFYYRGYQSAPIPGVTVWTSYVEGEHRDIAVVRIARGALGKHIPQPIPMAEADPQDGQTIFSVGAANGAWPTAWQGHVNQRAQDGGTVIYFTPPPAGGRSGSAIFNADGTKIVALIAWSAGEHGIAMTATEVRRAFTGQKSDSQRGDDTRWAAAPRVLPYAQLEGGGELATIPHCVHGVRLDKDCFS